MNTIIGKNKPVKDKRHIQRTSYKALEKLTVIQEAKRISVLAALCYFGVNQFMFNELHRIGIAVTAGSIKMQMVMILSTTCADKYPGASQQFCASKSWFYQIIVRMHKSAWMDENLTCEWVDQVLNKQPEALTTNKPLSLLVMDSFEGHLTDM
ncbi:8043_t:CDS:2, partial [Gigaspora margarita]